METLKPINREGLARNWSWESNGQKMNPKNKEKKPNKWDDDYRNWKRYIKETRKKIGRVDRRCAGDDQREEEVQPNKPQKHIARPTAALAPIAALLGRHHRHELLVVDLAVTVDVGFPDHLVHLLVGELLAEVGHHVTQLGGRDEAVAVLV